MGISMVYPAVSREVYIPERAAVFAELSRLSIPYSPHASTSTPTKLHVRILGIWKRSSRCSVARQLALWYVGSNDADSESSEEDAERTTAKAKRIISVEAAMRPQ